MKYFKLTDPQHENIIVRAEGRNHQKYVKEKGWIDTGIMIKYFCDEDDLYNCYEEISEEKAMRIINN